MRACAPYAVCDIDRGEGLVGEVLVCGPPGKAPVMAERVLGVMVATFERDAAELEFMSCSQALVPGDGGGKTELMMGVRPVPGVRPVRGVSPVRKLVGSNAGSG